MENYINNNVSNFRFELLNCRNINKNMIEQLIENTSDCYKEYFDEEYLKCNDIYFYVCFVNDIIVAYIDFNLYCLYQQLSP